MNPTLRLQRGISSRELLAWSLLGGVFAFAAGTRLEAVDASAELDASLLLAALGGLAVPLRLLTLLATPAHARLRRALGEPCGSMLRFAVRDAAMLCAVWSVTIWLGLWAFHSTWALILNMLIAFVSVYALWMMVLALHQIAAGSRGAWQVVAGGGAFGPVATAPLLYAPALGYTAGLFVPVLIMTVLLGVTEGTALGAADGIVDGIADGIATRRHEAVAIAAGAALLIALGVPIAGIVVTVRKIDARAALLTVEQAHEQGFYRSEHIGAAPGFLTLLYKTADVRFVADVWHRRFPASGLVTVGLALLAAWATPHSAWGITAGVTAAAIVLYSGGRAADLARVQKLALPTLRFLGGRGERSTMKHLAVGLALPGLAALAIGWSTGAWPACAIGVAAGFATVLAAPLPLLAVLGRIAPLAAIIAIAAGPGTTV